MDNSNQKNYELVPSSKKELINTSPLVSRGLDLAKNIVETSCKANLMFVDDEPGILTLVKSRFQKMGYRVTTFENGQDALEELKKNHYDLLSTNVLMSGMNGIELLQKAKELKPQLMTMIVSGTIAESDDKKAMAKKMGCIACLSKPTTFKELMATIEKVLKTKRGPE